MAAPAALRIAVYSPRTKLRAYLDQASERFCPVAFVNLGEGSFHDLRPVERLDGCHERMRCRDCGFEKTQRTCPDARIANSDFIVCIHCERVRRRTPIDIKALAALLI